MFGLEIISNNLVADLRGWSLRESKIMVIYIPEKSSYIILLCLSEFLR